MAGNGDCATELDDDEVLPPRYDALGVASGVCVDEGGRVFVADEKCISRVLEGDGRQWVYT